MKNLLYIVCYKSDKIMRTVTFLGLTMIAKCIDPNRMADAVGIVVTVVIIAIVIDVIDTYKRWSK